MAKDETKLPLKEMVRQINKKLGYEAVRVGSKANTSYIYRRPSGIFSIDLATGGGLPVGTMVEIAGPEGAGKNLLADLYIAQSQQIFGDEFNCAILTAEYKYDKLRARQNGVDIALTDEEILELEASEGLPLEDSEKAALQTQTGEFYLVEEGPAEVLLETLLALMGSGEIQLVIIDSLANLIPDEEIKKSLDESAQLAARASMLTRFMQRAHPLLGCNKMLVIALNQVRAPIGYTGPSRYIPQYKLSEPFAIRHGIAGRIEISSGAAIKEADVKVGKELRWHISKGKAGFHEGPYGIIRYKYDTGIDFEEDFVNTIAPFCERSGSWFSVPIGNQKDLRVQGTKKLVEYAMANPEWVESVKQDVYKLKGIRFLHREITKETGDGGGEKDRKRRRRKDNP